MSRVKQQTMIHTLLKTSTKVFETSPPLSAITNNVRGFSATSSSISNLYDAPPLIEQKRRSILASLELAVSLKSLQELLKVPI